jgi:hypothetical protein
LWRPARSAAGHLVKIEIEVDTVRAPITAGITMFPLLLQNGAVVDSEYEQTAVQLAKGTKGSIGVDGTYVYLAIMSNVTVTESAYVLQALGARVEAPVLAFGSWAGSRPGDGRWTPGRRRRCSLKSCRK